MTRKSRRPPRRDEPHKPGHPPAGAVLDRYEASMMLMIASRALEAHDDNPPPPRAQQRRLRKPRAL